MFKNLFDSFLIFLLLLGVSGVAIGSFVALMGYSRTRLIESCIADAQCLAKSGQFQSLSLLSTARAEFDIGSALFLVSAILVFYVLVTLSRDSAFLHTVGRRLLQRNSGESKSTFSFQLVSPPGTRSKDSKGRKNEKEN